MAFLRRVPLSPTVLISTGCALAATGVVVGLLVNMRGWVHQATLLPLLIGPALLSIRGGTTILGALKTWVGRGSPGMTIGTDDPATIEYVERLRRVLTKADARHTVEWIARNLGWPEQDVVRTLGWLQARGELREDLDITSGEFYYVVIPVPRDLSTRLSSPT